jgi:hypothetical protein
MMRMDASIAASERTQGRHWMKCPKCGKDIPTIVRVKGYETINECKSCGCCMTDHRQSEIEYLRQALIDERNTVSALSRKCSQLECDREYNARLCEKNDAELTALKEENERLRSGLEKLGGKKSGKCLGCGAKKTYYGHGYWFIDHAKDCPVSALLKGDANDCTT